MSSLSSPVLIGAGFALVVGIATFVLVVARHTGGRGAMILAAIALGVSVIGLTAMRSRLEKKMTDTNVTAGGTTRVRESGWAIDSRWFFAFSVLISLPIFMVAWRARDRPPELEKYSA